MVFSSAVFLFIFLPWTLIVHYLLSPRYRNFFLLLMSLVFYSWGEGAMTALLILSIAVNYIGGLSIGHFKKRNAGAAKSILAFFIIINLLVLVYFKYFNFIISELMKINLITPNTLSETHMPIGISFYTFHIMSYLIDVYRRDAVPQKNPFDLGLYIFLFPQLVAGPIIRYKDISQKIASRFIIGERFTNGVTRFIRGFAKKMIIANTVAVIADQCFKSELRDLPTVIAWLGILAYTIQIYFDFSGYSDMAIGLGKMLGFNFPENFNHPYSARSIRDFWQRWHISLSTWFRDYLYIPLGGNRNGKLKTIRNLFIVFFLTGFWHGANWTFIVWGLFHGFFLALERTSFGTIVTKLPRLFQHVYVILVVMVAWVFFRADNFQHAIGYIKVMAGFSDSKNYITLIYLNSYTVSVFIAGLVFCTNLRAYVEKMIYDRLALTHNKLEISYKIISYFSYVALFFCSTIELAQNNYNPFIYFRF